MKQGRATMNVPSRAIRVAKRWMAPVLITWAVGILSGCSGDDVDFVGSCPETEDSEPCEVFRRVNEARVGEGLEPYTYDSALARAAQLHADDMVANDFFSHDSPDGRDFAERARDAGYDDQPTAENIAQGSTAEQVMEMWMGSSGHRGNILSDRSTDIGVGFRDGIWVQVFGRSE